MENQNETMETKFTTNTPLTDDTFMECYNAGEWNKDQRLKSIKNSISFTNLWLSFIGIYYLMQIIKEIIIYTTLIKAGIQIEELLYLLTR